MKKLFFGVFAVLLLFATTPSHAVISIAFDPTSQHVMAGNPVDVRLVISGLGDFAPDSLGIFDLDIIFDPTILDFNSVVFGDPILGDQLDLFALGSLTSFDASIPNKVNLFELSFDSATDLDTLQRGSFTLATLTFDTLALGTSPLDIFINELGDASARSLVLDATTQSGSVTATPEPATLLLLGSGLFGLAGLRRTLKRS